MPTSIAFAVLAILFVLALVSWADVLVERRKVGGIWFVRCGSWRLSLCRRR